LNRRNRVFKICCIIFGIFIVLDFIPIKFASRLSDFTSSSEGVYICKVSTATDGNWVAEKELNPWLSESTYLILKNSEVFGSVSKIFITEYVEPSNNTFVFWGTVTQEQWADNLRVNILNADRWNILYPIQRKTIRGLYAPRGYFTIYDYNWKEAIKEIIS